GARAYRGSRHEHRRDGDLHDQGALDPPPRSAAAHALSDRARALRRRQVDVHGGAMALPARDRDCAAVALADLLHDREPEARPTEVAGARFVDAEEALRQAGEIASGDADAGVDDGQLDHPHMLWGRGRPGADRDASPGGRELEGVVDQIDQYLPE